MISRKGHTFTIEALFGALLFILLILSFSAYANHLSEDPWTVPDERIADDILTVLEKEGTLSTLNETAIGNEISNILGNRSFRLKMQTYEYSKGSMKHLRTSNIGDELPDGAEVAVAQRSFLSIEDGSIANYTIARLSLWR